jgi:hypothetical protein
VRGAEFARDRTVLSQSVSVDITLKASMSSPPFASCFLTRIFSARTENRLVSNKRVVLQSLDSLCYAVADLDLFSRPNFAFSL